MHWTPRFGCSSSQRVEMSASTALCMQTRHAPEQLRILFHYMRRQVCRSIYFYTVFEFIIYHFHFPTTANEYFEAVKLGGGDAVKKRLSMVLDRVEDLKRVLATPQSLRSSHRATITMNLPLPPTTLQAPLGLPPTSPSPTMPQASPSQLQRPSSAVKFSQSEMDVLKASSRINGKTFQPWYKSR